ncbi:hypothetical protein GW17_00039119 [Ensete ventricosum]|nr:hypothetical protein GW17_00039119 [Ensete ventricosum]
MQGLQFRPVPGGTYRSIRLSVRGPPAIGRFRQNSIVGGRLREKSTVGGRLRKKKGRREQEEEKKEYLARASSSPARRRRSQVARARCRFFSHARRVLVHGSAEATEHLKQHCIKHVCPHVYAPHIEETIDVTSDLCAYKLGDNEIAWVDAEVGKTNDMLTLLPLSSAPPTHKSVLIGDLKLADFKQFLASQGVQVEFTGGALRCGEHVTLRKISDASQKGGTGAQQILIEGPLTEEYYKIRKHLYSQFYLL